MEETRFYGTPQAMPTTPAGVMSAQTPAGGPKQQPTVPTPATGVRKVNPSPQPTPAPAQNGAGQQRFYGQTAAGSSQPATPAAPSPAPAPTAPPAGTMPAPPPQVIRSANGNLSSPAPITDNPLGYKTNTGVYVTHQPWFVGRPQPPNLSPWSPAVRK